ncbi:hypothetical protein BJY01DRAFT_164614 [Aspergillus pseudoustus]|uniref:Hydrophobin n=1 Tax=Aspergillus pseudoustus TaxID=1810923 RepID=A0ABR4IA03_9EURO
MTFARSSFSPYIHLSCSPGFSSRKNFTLHISHDSSPLPSPRTLNLAILLSRSHAVLFFFCILLLQAPVSTVHRASLHSISCCDFGSSTCSAVPVQLLGCNGVLWRMKQTRREGPLL